MAPIACLQIMKIKEVINFNKELNTTTKLHSNYLLLELR